MPRRRSAAPRSASTPRATARSRSSRSWRPTACAGSDRVRRPASASTSSSRTTAACRRNGEWLAGVMKLVNHPRCGTLPDFGNFYEYDRYQGVAELMPFAKAVSAKSHDFDADGNETDQGLSPAHEDRHSTPATTGWVGIEYEGERLPERDGIARDAPAAREESATEMSRRSEGAMTDQAVPSRLSVQDRRRGCRRGSRRRHRRVEEMTRRSDDPCRRRCRDAARRGRADPDRHHRHRRHGHRPLRGLRAGWPRRTRHSVRVEALCDVCEPRLQAAKKAESDHSGRAAIARLRQLRRSCWRGRTFTAVLIASPEHWHRADGRGRDPRRQGRLRREADDAATSRTRCGCKKVVRRQPGARS